MPKAVKWILAIIAGLIVTVIIAVLVAPVVFNLEKYKPQIEAEASKAIGRTVTLGGDIKPSVFPWVGILISDVHLGNPEGFEEKDFVSLGLFEMRVKLLPLISGDIVIKRFIVKDTRVVIERTKDGRSNLDGLGKPGPSQTSGKPPKAQSPSESDKSPLPIKSLEAEEFAIRNTSIVIIDQAVRSRQEIKDINLVLTDLSLDKPVGVSLDALIDGKPVALTGSVGPVGPQLGQSPVKLDLTANLIEQVAVKIKGVVDTPQAAPKMDLQVDVAPFSLRKVMKKLNQPLPIETADPEVLNAIALSLKLAGTPEKVSVSNGKLTLDDSTMTFQARAQAFDKPDLKLGAEMDSIDLDRYLPVSKEGEIEESPPDKGQKTPTKTNEKIDYSPLRKMLLDAQVKIGALKVKNAKMQNILIKTTARNGIIRLDPLNIDLYQGRVSTTGSINVQKDQPRSALGLTINTVQTGPLLKDVLKKEIVEGAMSAGININFSGDQADQIRRSLDGKGELKFNDGAIVGIDLANMVRNVQSAFGLAENTSEKPRTDFTELLVPFAVSDGIASLNSAKLNSPLLRLTAGGQADLVKEALNMRVEPTFVATIKGQGDTEQRSGLMVPVIIRGSFTDPKFQPDLKALLTQELPDKEELQKLIPPKEDIEKTKEDLQKNIEKKAQELFKGLPFGNQKGE